MIFPSAPAQLNLYRCQYPHLTASASFSTDLPMPFLMLYTRLISYYQRWTIVFSASMIAYTWFCQHQSQPEQTYTATVSCSHCAVFDLLPAAANLAIAATEQPLTDCPPVLGKLVSNTITLMSSPSKNMVKTTVTDVVCPTTASKDPV